MRFKFIVLLFCKVTIIQAEISAYQIQGGNKEEVFESRFRAFEPNPTSLYGAILIMAEPRDACQVLPPRPTFFNTDTPCVLLATEGGCDLRTKILLAQLANYDSIVILMKTEHLTILNVPNEARPGCKINVSFLGAAAGKKLEQFVYRQFSNDRYLVDITYNKRSTEKSIPQYKKTKKSYNYETSEPMDGYFNPEDFKLDLPKLIYLVVLIISVGAIYQAATATEREEPKRRDQEQWEREREKKEEERERHEQQFKQKQRERQEKRERQEEQERQRREEKQENQNQQNNHNNYNNYYRVPSPTSTTALTRPTALLLLGFGIFEQPNKDQIEKAYRREAKKFHPDKFPEHRKKEKEQEFIELTAAKNILLIGSN